ncbi:PD-(D/E)XK motif protein [Verrucomicrobiales bacterium]|nr:PD-(D/E)XK motif protein [Verrucomicrobiales bacterium]
MSFITEIRGALAGVTAGTAIEVEGLPPDQPGWIIREDARSFAAAIPVEDDLIFNEEFSNVRVRTATRNLRGHPQNFLQLECSEFENRDPFAPVCSEFLSPANREELTNEPGRWTRRWAKMLGNAFRDLSVYPVIGELFVYNELAKAGINTNWTGPDSSSHDLQGNDFDIEVKSTIRRYGSVAKISGQHQLLAPNTSDLFLAFVRMEEHPTGVCVESLMKEIQAVSGHESGMEEFHSKLKKLGLPDGSPARWNTFAVLETRVFVVDGNFPRIVNSDFVGGCLPDSIIRFEYEIDLSGIVSVPLLKFIENQQRL